MPILPQSHPRWLKGTLVVLGGVTIAAVLAACGGSDTQSQSSSESSSSLGERLKALAVPPAWRGRVPGPEVINGITVPPEPAPSVNNATLAGVDSNANGVRDDVERLIAKDFGLAKAKHAELLKFAAAEQAVIVSQNTAAISLYINLISCALEHDTATSAELNKLTYALLTTTERSNAYGLTLAGSGGGECK